MPTSPLTLVRSRGPILADASRRRRRPATLEAKIATIRRTRPELAAHIEALVDDLLTTMQGRREPETSLGAVAGVLRSSLTLRGQPAQDDYDPAQWLALLARLYATQPVAGGMCWDLVQGLVDGDEDDD